MPEINYRAAQLARRVADEFARDERPPGVRRRRARPDEPHGLAVAGRERSRLPRRHASTSSSRPTPRRRARWCAAASDLLLIETIFDTLNAKAAIFAVQGVFEELGVELPLIISGTITDASGRTLSGQTTEAFWNSIRHARAARGRPQLRARRDGSCGRTCRSWRASRTRYVCAYPNAGLPNAFGEYDETPQETAEILREFADVGLLNIVGGCCGTTPEHIRADPRCGRKHARARADAALPVKCRLSGLEPLNIDDDSLFVNVGERTNVTGSAKFRKLIEAGDYAAALDVARQQVASGAQIIDVNMDEGMLDSEAAMVRFLHLIAARAGHRARARS